MNRRIFWLCLLFISPALILIVLLGSPFQNYLLASNTTKLTSFGALYVYHFPNNQEIPQNADGKYMINQNDLEKGDLSKPLLNAIFGNPQGWFQICFHNVNSTFYLRDYNTQLSEPVIFGFNDKDITVLPQEKNCDNTITINQKFSIIINNKFIKSPDESMAFNFVKNDKGFLEYARKNNIDVSTVTINNFIPYLVGEIYLIPSLATYIVGYFIVFFIWAGIIFTILETWKLISK